MSSSSARSAAVRVRNFLAWHSRGPRGWVKHRVLRPVFGMATSSGPIRLHIGSGCRRLDAWVNVDLLAAPEVDLAIDIRRGLPFRGVEAVYAEHFLEHLTGVEGLAFLRTAWGALAPGAWMRLSTPNLDWVIAAHSGGARTRAEKELECLGLNRSFHGWGHRFLWNQALLLHALESSGFDHIHWCRYGESEIALFRDVEQHPPCPDSPDLPHVLIVEARRGAFDQRGFETLGALFREEVERYL